MENPYICFNSHSTKWMVQQQLVHLNKWALRNITVNFVEKTKFEIYVEVHHSIDMNSDTPVHGSVSNDKDKSKDLISDDGNGNIDSNNNVESLGQFDDSLFLTQNKYKEIDTFKEQSEREDTYENQSVKGFIDKHMKIGNNEEHKYNKWPKRR